MSISHLSSDELDRLLSGDELPEGRAEHLQACVACRRRRDGFLAVVAEAGGGDASGETLARIRGNVLRDWAAPVRRHVWRWVAAAAAVVILGLVPLLHQPRMATSVVNADAVLEDVDRVLARDPLAAMASEDLLFEVVPPDGESGERSAS
jgi:hypothetical protein